MNCDDFAHGSSTKELKVTDIRTANFFRNISDLQRCEQRFQDRRDLELSSVEVIPENEMLGSAFSFKTEISLHLAFAPRFNLESKRGRKMVAIN